jgi:hypothetical protein
MRPVARWTASGLRSSIATTVQAMTAQSARKL